MALAAPGPPRLLGRLAQRRQPAMVQRGIAEHLDSENGDHRRDHLGSANVFSKRRTAARGTWLGWLNSATAHAPGALPKAWITHMSRAKAITKLQSPRKSASGSADLVGAAAGGGLNLRRCAPGHRPTCSPWRIIRVVVPPTVGRCAAWGECARRSDLAGTASSGRASGP